MTPDHVEALREALAQLAAADAPDVVAEARTGARARARALIEDMLVDELVLAAARVAKREPEPRRRADPGPARERSRRARADRTPAGDAWWTYCVLEASAAESLGVAELDGIEPGTAVEAVREGPLAGLVSRVPLAEYDDERLREHLNDIDWVERAARAHEAVLEAALAHAAIVPMRLCTLYRDHEGLRRFLADESGELRRSLDAVDGRVEWGVKLFADHDRLQAALAAERGDDAGATGEGAGYLARKQRDRALRAEADELASRCADAVHRRLESLADAARANAVQRPEAHGRDAEMLLNGVYLVERVREDELRALCDELHGEWADAGFELELTGPWPPYNFVSTAAPAAQ